MSVLLLTLLAAPPIVGFVSGEEQAGEGANPDQAQEEHKAPSANLTKRHEELNQRRAAHEQTRKERHQRADQAQGEPDANAEK
jgi:hypothetical protein